MATQAQQRAFREALAGLSERAQQALRRVYLSLDPDDQTALFRAVTAASVEVLTELGEFAAVAGADFYDDLRESHPGALPPFAAVVPEAAPVEQIVASTRWALVQADPLGNLMKVADRLTKQPGRIAVEQSIAADPARPRYARIPKGPVTCRFCAMLASRGAVYLSEETADGHDYHDFCDCEAVAIFGDDLPEGFDPDHYFEIYRAEGGAGIDLSGDRSPLFETAR